MIVVNVVVDMVAVVVVVVAEELGVLPAGLVTGPAPATVMTA